jgi:ribosomal-protein-alanine N-acetyltransferase
VSAGRATLRPPTARDRADFLAAVRRSRQLHRPWVHPPRDAETFAAWRRRCGRPDHAGFLALAPDGQFAGVVNLNHIVRGALRGAYLGFYAFEPYAGRGLMRDAVGQALGRAFGPLALHRVEANVQPGNAASLALIRRLGFRREGFSPRYLKIGSRWRDHERWALLAEDWKPRARR